MCGLFTVTASNWNRIGVIWVKWTIDWPELPLESHRALDDRTSNRETGKRTWIRSPAWQMSLWSRAQWSLRVSSRPKVQSGEMNASSDVLIHEEMRRRILEVVFPTASHHLNRLSVATDFEISNLRRRILPLLAHFNVNRSSLNLILDIWIFVVVLSTCSGGPIPFVALTQRS